MTNTANDTTPEPVFILTRSGYGSARDYLADAMSGFEPSCYVTDIPTLGIDRVARDDWDNIWSQGDEVRHTEEDAEAALLTDEGYRGWVRVTLDDVRDALWRAFGEGRGA